MRNRLLNKVAYTAIELLIVASMVGAIPVTIYLKAMKSAKAASCLSNLRNIYMGVQLYEIDFGKLPDAKFYPESAKSDPKSIINILSQYIDDKRVFICPAMPDELKQKALTYVWNDAYNNRFLDTVRNKSSEWLMVEMTVVDPEIPPPHQGCYNILFFDGHAASVKEAIHMSPTPADLKEPEKDKFFAEKSK